jgi:hypothetical protein
VGVISISAEERISPFADGIAIARHASRELAVEALSKTFMKCPESVNQKAFELDRFSAWHPSLLAGCEAGGPEHREAAMAAEKLLAFAY